MITLQNLGDSILFTFEENDKYLHNGTISVPMNSLILVTDDSEMATFRKAASNDIFVSALYSDFGMTKAELEEWYAENMVSEVTEEDVDEKIAEAVGEETDRAISAETALSGAIDSIDSRLTEDEGVIGAGLNALNDSLSGKADISAVTEAIDAIDAAYKAADSVISGAVNNLSTALQNESQRAISAETALSGAIDTKIDESAITRAITSASTDSEIPSAKAVYDALQESGLDEDTERLISGSLNDLNERKLDASAYTPTDLTNYYTKSETSGATEIATALNNKANKTAAVGGYRFGSTNNVNYLKYRSVSNNDIGTEIYYPKINGKSILTNNSTWAQNNYNFQLVETSAITTSVTSSSTDSQVPSAKAVNDKLGGLSLVKISQSAYDALENKDANTLYIIVDEPPFDGKYKFTLTDDSVVSGACDSSSAITTAETSAYASTLKEAVIGDCVTSIGNEAFYGCTSLTSVTIPNSVTSISFYAFEGCSSLISINIPSSVTNIKDGAFSGCTSLTSITVNAATPPTLTFDAFVDTNNCPIYVPSASVEVYKTASVWSDYASRIQAIS